MRILLLVIIILQTLNSVSQEEIVQPVKRQTDFEYLSAPDSLGNRVELKMPKNLSNKTLATVKLPYPVIFVHGLNSGSNTWDIFTNWMDAQYGVTYGGRIDFCLNYDGNNYLTNKNYWPAVGADMALYTSTTNLISGDYYYVNFNVAQDGNPFPSSSYPFNVKSNQQAIVKQGLAVRQAIYMVLKMTGRDKVILMGHSMGGLASREYLQNTSIWQSDGKHHVAKLSTTGTPHGGSNSTSFGLGIGGVDEQSEAVRDLRRTYYYSADNGVYLWGGLELQNNSTNMDDNINVSGFDFYNVDVNCNGSVGESITGLNQKSIYTNLDYSCIIGRCSGCILDPNPGDGVVWDYWADLKNIYGGLGVNRFYYYASATTEIHTDLPEQNFENMEGLDEPNEYLLSYNVGFDTNYTAFTTVQPFDGYPYDYDDYKFTVNSSSVVTVNVNNININNLMVRIYDMSLNQIGSTVSSGGFSSITFTQAVTAGSYYLEIYGVPTVSSYLTPYNFTLNQAPSSIGITESLINLKNFRIFPNPASNIFYIETDIQFEKGTEIAIINTLGQTVLKQDFKKEIDITGIPSGYYTLKVLKVNSQPIISKFIKD